MLLQVALSIMNMSYTCRGRKVLAFANKCGGTSDAPDDWGRKCPVCGALFENGDACMLLMCDGDPFGNTLVHQACLNEETCETVAAMYEKWLAMSGIWHPAMPQPGM